CTSSFRRVGSLPIRSPMRSSPANGATSSAPASACATSDHDRRTARTSPPGLVHAGPRSAARRDVGVAGLSGRAREPGEQVLLGGDRRLLAGLAFLVMPVAVQDPRLAVVGEQHVEVGLEPLLERAPPDGKAGFGAAEEIAVHPVRAGAEVLRVAAVLEVV